MAKSLRQEIIKSNIETLESSSVHAIPNIIRNKFYTVKVMWILCFFISSIGCAIFIWDSICDYLNFDVITNVKIDYVNKLKFPMITICSVYPQQPKNVLNMLNDTIISCTFNFIPCKIQNDFEFYNDSVYNFCFRFNSGKNMKGSSVETKYAFGKGQLNALNLELFDNSITQFETKGFMVFISDENIDSVNNLGIYMSSGKLTSLSITKYAIIKKPIPYSNCIDDLTSINSYHSECYKKTFSIDKKYKFSECSSMCLQKYIGNVCNVQIAQLGKSYYDDKRIVSYFNEADQVDIFCATATLVKFKSSYKELNKCDCPLECETSGYTYSPSFADYPTKLYAYSLVNNSPLLKSIYENNSIDNLKDNLYFLRLYFEDMKETIIQHEIKIQVSDLVSGLGGTMGLFLGILL